MVKPRLLSLIALLLAGMCWLGTGVPVAAQTISTVVIAETASGEKPVSLFSFSGQRPTNLGVKDGQFAPCPGTPNCVSSQAPTSDKEHSIEPIAYTSSPTQALAHLKTVIQEMPRTNIVTESGSYVYAEFTSALMGFVDDVEFYLDEAANVIHVRSASRLGQSDLGVNRKRIEAIRSRLSELESLA